VTAATRHRPAATGRSLVRVGALGLCNVGAIVEIDTYYDILGVPPGADEREIKRAFRRLARQFHPDLNVGDEEAARHFKKIDRAYKVLRDTKMRAAYDAHLEQLRVIVEHDRPGRGGVAVVVRRQFWRQARTMAASGLVLGVCLVAFAMSWGEMTASLRPADRAAALPFSEVERIMADVAPSQPPAASFAEAPPGRTADVAARAPQEPAGASVTLDALPPRSTEMRLAGAGIVELPPALLSLSLDDARAVDMQPRAFQEMPAVPASLDLAAPRRVGFSSKRNRLAQRDRERWIPSDAGQAMALPIPEPELVQPPERNVVLVPERTDVAPWPQRNGGMPLEQRSSEDIAQAARLMALGERYLAQGNVAIAREYFERAADLGLGSGAMKMAETHDAGALAARGSFGPRANPAEARKWYLRAMALGLPEAEAQLRRLDGH